MTTLYRLLGISALLTLAGCSLFGFLATYEPPQIIELRWLYGGVGVLSLLGAGYLGTRASSQLQKG